MNINDHPLTIWFVSLIIIALFIWLWRGHKKKQFVSSVNDTPQEKNEGHICETIPVIIRLPPDEGNEDVLFIPFQGCSECHRIYPDSTGLFNFIPPDTRKKVIQILKEQGWNTDEVTRE